MKNERIIDIIILVLIFLFLLSYFTPGLLLSLTTTCGGDTGSHYPTAVYMKEVLLSQGKIMGWDQGNYAGYPLFYHYFPLTFVLMALLNFVLPMQIAFKLITVLGIFLLPFFTYFFFKFLKYKFPIPIIGACFALAFLFMEANSMWGGNIPSVLAGEYSYSLSLSILVLFLGSLYDGIVKKDKIVFNAFLIFLIGFSHGYTLIFSGIAVLFFLFNLKEFRKNLWYLVRLYLLGFSLLAFWLIPFIANIPYVTSYVTKWRIDSLLQVVPLILIPFFVLGTLSLILNIFERRGRYLIYLIFSSLFMYFVATNFGMLDIRFIPFFQLFLTIFAATIICRFIDRIRALPVLAVISFFMVVLWIVPNVSYIPNWIKWNYEGFESKQSWPLFKEINSYLEKNNGGRVVYEHSMKHNAFGTERAFENLPHFAKRNTLEGLYMQSSISSPFVFYIQSQVSRFASTPFPQYKYSSLNLKDVLKRLELFNVSHYIARSDQAKNKAVKTQGLVLKKRFDDYEIYKLVTHDGSYVVPLKYEPVVYEGDNWKKDFFDWFVAGKNLNQPLVYTKNLEWGEVDWLRKRKQGKIWIPRGEIKEEILPEKIKFSTDLIGYPHLIKVTYHPNWRVEGADRIYLVSPSFMLVYPTQNKVVLSFEKSQYNYIGEYISLIGFSIVALSAIIFIINARKT